MRVFLVLSTLMGLLGNDSSPVKISRENTLRKEAMEALRATNYPEALQKLKILSDSLGVMDEEVRSNLALAYFKTEDLEHAAELYKTLAPSANPKVRSVAHQQLSHISMSKDDLKAALVHAKEALKADPTNEDARYNYELLKKLKQEQDQQNQDNQDNKEKQDQKQDQQQQDQQQQQQDGKDKQDEKQQQQQQEEQQQDKQEEGKPDKDQKDSKKQEGEPKDPKNQEEAEQMKEEDTKSKEDKEREMYQSRQMNKVPMDKAQMILEALKNQELQYYQQMRRESSNRNTGKPDW